MREHRLSSESDDSDNLMCISRFLITLNIVSFLSRALTELLLVCELGIEIHTTKTFSHKNGFVK